MTKRIDLPGGGWAEIKEPDDLTNRDRRALRRRSMSAIVAYGKLGTVRSSITPGAIRTVDDLSPELAAQIGEALNGDDMNTLDDLQGAMIVAWVKQWGPQPGEVAETLTMDNVDDLPTPIFDALAAATTALGDGSVDTSPNPALDSPTVPSGGSDAA